MILIAYIYNFTAKHQYSLWGLIFFLQGCECITQPYDKVIPKLFNLHNLATRVVATLYNVHNLVPNLIFQHGIATNCR